VAISEAVSKMSAPYIWSILFFTMLILLGLDSEFGTLEGAITPLVVDMNLFPKIRKEIVSGGKQIQ
jgi:solute carrier family 6 amino acid/orphan transporter-like 15/16/17/18/20